MNTFLSIRRAALGCAVLAATGAATAQPAARAESHCRTVQANVPWQGTGISVGLGQFVCVAADGLWSHGGQGLQAIGPFYGPEGFGKDEPNTVPEVVSRTGALIGRIGSNAPFLIEKQLCFLPGANGELRLQMNDEPGTFGDNRGHMHVQIVRWADSRWMPERIALNPQACAGR